MLKNLCAIIRKQLATPQDKVLAAMVLVFLVIFSYWTYQQTAMLKETSEKGKSFNNLPDTSSSNTQRYGLTENGNIEQQNSQSNAEEVWVATDYSEGDIDTDNYTVKSGDTLWEIAEAVYGNGTDWGHILNANSSQIGFLPNGQQALIFPGQVLQLPSLM